MSIGIEERVIVGCPHCSSRYALPLELMGSGGARVRCPACQHRFVVTASGEPEAVTTPAPDPVEHAIVAAAIAPEPEIVAEVGAASPEFAAAEAASPESALDAVRALDHPPGSLAAAALRGRLFAERGPELLEAFEAWRARARVPGAAAEFRAALDAVAGVDLSVPEPADPERA
jgi:predicted Zn finger-like uncharacterized protein